VNLEVEYALLRVFFPKGLVVEGLEYMKKFCILVVVGFEMQSGETLGPALCLRLLILPVRH
jgi:hypothetical protein